jgi:hypothetical protein
MRKAGESPVTIELSYQTVEKSRWEWAENNSMYYIPFDKQNPHYESLGEIPGSRQKKSYRDVKTRTYCISVSLPGYGIQTESVSIPREQSTLTIRLSPTQ